MADMFGAVSFPMAAATDPTSAGDPALAYLGEFLKAAINADCALAWKTKGISPSNDAVSFVFTDDPRNDFDESRLPALYIFRGKATSTTETDDLLTNVTEIKCYWLMDGAQDDHLHARTQMGNAIYMSAFRSLVRGRVPAYIVAGDTEAFAATLGSWVWGYAGVKMVRVLDSTPLSLTLDKIDGEGKSIPFLGLAMHFEITERTARIWLGTHPTIGEGFVDNKADALNTTVRIVGQFSEVP